MDHSLGVLQGHMHLLSNIGRLQESAEGVRLLGTIQLACAEHGGPSIYAGRHTKK